jgi:hypothetical protein
MEGIAGTLYTDVADEETDRRCVLDPNEAAVLGRAGKFAAREEADFKE